MAQGENCTPINSPIKNPKIMATIPQLIAILPQFLRENPHAFTTETLAALDQILATLDNTSDTEIVKAMTQWFQSHSDDEYESLDRFVAPANREMCNKSAPPDNTEAEIRQNLFEACQVREEQQENPPPKNS